MRAQGYDGASVVSGHVSDAQTRIQRVYPKAQYVHCRPHVHNLCIIHSSKVRIVRNHVMDTIKEVSFASQASAKIFLSFQNQLNNNADVQEDMGRRHKLKMLCETHWASQADCLNIRGSGHV